MKSRHIESRRKLEHREARASELEAMDGMTLRRMARQGHAGARAILEREHEKAYAASTQGPSF
jgi:hypothetical protein